MTLRSLIRPRHCSSVNGASRAYVEPNAEGASRSAASRTSRRVCQSSGITARTTTMAPMVPAGAPATQISFRPVADVTFLRYRNLR